MLIFFFFFNYYVYLVYSLRIISVIKYFKLFMNNKKNIFSFAIIFLNLFIPSLCAGNKFDGVYKSYLLLGVNRLYYVDDKCPSKLPITVNLRVEGNNITGNISNNLSNSTQCSNYQKAKIKGEIDDSGNIVKIKFTHNTKSGQKEDAYAIEGNLNGELILKSKLRALYRKNAKFFLTRQNPSNINDEYIDERGTNNLGNEKQLKELEETRLKKLEEKQLKELEEIQLKEQKGIKKKTNLLFN